MRKKNYLIPGTRRFGEKKVGQNRGLISGHVILEDHAQESCWAASTTDLVPGDHQS